VNPERIDVTPEPTPAEAEAIRRALEALGLIEGDGADGGQGVSLNNSGDGSVTSSMPNLVSDP
jgi:hypothetical protein